MGSLLEDSDGSFSWSGPCWPLLLPFQPLSPTPNQSPGMAMATEATVMVATTGPMGTGAGEGRRDLLSPMLWLNRNPNLTDMDIAPMATTGPMGTGAGEGRKGLQSPTMDMDTAVATMAATVADIGARQKSERDH